MRKLLWLCAGVALAWITLSGVSTSAAVAPLSSQRVTLDAASTTQAAKGGRFYIFPGCHRGCHGGTFCC